MCSQLPLHHHLHSILFSLSLLTLSHSTRGCKLDSYHAFSLLLSRRVVWTLRQLSLVLSLLDCLFKLLPPSEESSRTRELLPAIRLVKRIHLQSTLMRFRLLQQQQRNSGNSLAAAAVDGNTF